MSRDDEIRTSGQNRLFHKLVGQIADQVKWAGDYMDPEDWKRLFLASAYGQKMVPNPLDPQAPFVVVNMRHSRGLVVPEMADLITAIQAFGDERGVQWEAEEAA